MSRLTSKRLADANRNGYFIEMKRGVNIKSPSIEQLYEKLAKYENIEEEVIGGCPLEVAFSLLDKEIIVNIYDKTYPCIVLDIRKDGDIICIRYFNKVLGYDEIEPLSNYGKTFWIVDKEKENFDNDRK